MRCRGKSKQKGWHSLTGHLKISLFTLEWKVICFGILFTLTAHLFTKSEPAMERGKIIRRKFTAITRMLIFTLKDHLAMS